MNEAIDTNPLIPVAMEIILHAGNAQNILMEVVQELSKDACVDTLRKQIAEAKVLINKAHQAQTTIIQGESQGNSVDYSLLFNHAQDTLMMTQSELLFVNAMIDVYDNLNKKIERLGATT
jgi:PTS system cellobiose-specific IIA component